MRKWTFAVMVLVASLGIACSGAATVSDTTAEAGAEEAAVSKKEAAARALPTYREVTLPAGTTLPLELQTAVASDTSSVEDPVRATLRRAVTVDGAQVLPAGAEVQGVVTAVERSGRVKGRARVAFRFNSVRHDGERVGIRTETIARLAEATKGEDATKIAAGAGAGAVVGGILGGGSGAAKGAAIGGAGGTGVVLATRGKEIRLAPGTSVATKLTAPVTVRVRVS